MTGGDDRLRALRRELEEALDDTRVAIREDTGRIARRAWTVPLIAGGLGFLAALAVSRRRKRLRE